MLLHELSASVRWASWGACCPLNCPREPPTAKYGSLFARLRGLVDARQNPSDCHRIHPTAKYLAGRACGMSGTAPTAPAVRTQGLVSTPRKVPVTMDRQLRCLLLLAR
jgi:hypothetical protein